jgi:uncharacterized metal-binding protein YceD (DUF177 family)
MNNFTINLGSISSSKKKISFEIKDSFFEAFTFSDVDHADISAIATLNKQGENIALNLSINGYIHQLSCDICTDELSIEIAAETNVIIKKSSKNLESTDEIIYVKENENRINLKQLIFELIILNTPIKRQHALDKSGKRTCNKEMVDLVNKYTQIKKQASDPRWDALRNLN